jgi:hypothetical protein
MMAALVAVIAAVLDAKFFSANDADSRISIPRRIDWPGKSTASPVMTTLAEGDAVADLVPKARVFGVGLDMMHLEGDSFAVPVLGPAMLACVVVAAKASFDKSLVLVSLVFRLSFCGVPAFPVGMVRSTHNLSRRDDSSPPQSLTYVLSVALRQLSPGQCGGNLRPCRGRHDAPDTVLVAEFRLPNLLLNVWSFGRVATRRIGERLPACHGAESSRRWKMS